MLTTTSPEFLSAMPQTVFDKIRVHLMLCLLTKMMHCLCLTYAH